MSVFAACVKKLIKMLWEIHSFSARTLSLKNNHSDTHSTLCFQRKSTTVFADVLTALKPPWTDTKSTSAVNRPNFNVTFAKQGWNIDLTFWNICEKCMDSGRSSNRLLVWRRNYTHFFMIKIKKNAFLYTHCSFTCLKLILHSINWNNVFCSG